MDFLFDPTFWSGLLAIILIDLVLAGDNAIVIGMAARNLPKHQQKQAIVWGTVGAIAIRAIMTILVVWLLNIPVLHLVGGLLLIWIAYKLLADHKEHDTVQAGSSLAAAIRTIIIADAVMGMDNVIAVAGASHGSFLLVILGLLVSVPVMVWGSTMILKAIERYPSIIYVGAAVLAYTAGSMITTEHLISGFFTAYPALKWLLIVLIVAGVLLAGRRKKQQLEQLHRQTEAAEREQEQPASIAEQA
ncbi:TerC family protein [Brevibacillus fulvus]|uniref:YjbE family integral membrane protein n=1 Tax=Brevibacillus fulvus TaxID=1125967 RepID=A0A938XXH1_9BACL|nr:TerC family protein [Brevibacillus fulvus]MBM7589959.1 YjbE family integral membrane protein [Brevibacillus fulvus]